MRKLLITALMLAASGAVAFGLSGPIGNVAQSAPAVGPGLVDSFTVSCAGSATPIIPAGGGMVAYSCQAPASGETGGTVLIAVGDSGIADPALGTRNSPVYSGDTVREWGGNVRQEYCRADTGTVTIYCRAIVMGAP